MAMDMKANCGAPAPYAQAAAPNSGGARWDAFQGGDASHRDSNRRPNPRPI